MIELAPRSASPVAWFGGQPIAIAAAALVIVVLGISSIALWRAYTGTAPETDRAVVARQLQVRTAQASEQLVEKTKGLEATQQELIDQLQVVQDQLLTVRRLLAAQQSDTKKLSEQVVNADRGDRRAAAILCQRASLRTRCRFRAPQTVSQGKAPRDQKREPHPRQARLIKTAALRRSACSGRNPAWTCRDQPVAAPNRPPQRTRFLQFFSTECELVHTCPRDSRAS